MFKSCTLFLGKLFLKSPVVHHISPKLVNVYFKNSKNISPVILNLKNVATVKFIINLHKGDNVADEYILIAVIDGSTNIELGVFESKKDAEEALLLLNIKISSLSKIFIKWIATIVLLLALFMVGKDLLILWSLSQNSLQQSSLSQRGQPLPHSSEKAVTPQSPDLTGQLTAPTPKASEAPVLSDEELLKLFEEAQKLTQAQSGSVSPDMNSQSGESAQQNQNLTPADMFIQGLK